MLEAAQALTYLEGYLLATKDHVTVIGNPRARRSSMPRTRPGLVPEHAS